MLKTTKYVDCSNCHITKNDSEVLGQQAAITQSEHNVPDMVVYGYKYGWFIPLDAAYPDELGLSKEFRSLLRKCYETGAEMLRLDGDGTEHDDLPRFNW
jgi:hypothetical protein